MSQSRKRVPNIDYVKAFAAIAVIAVHFRKNVQPMIPEEAFGAKSSLFFAANYQLFISCVPLFLIVTGYLMTNKKVDKKHYMSIVQLYTLYLLASIATLFLFMFLHDQHFSVQEIIYKISAFKMVGYAWYVEMYIGLALLLPFMNIMFDQVTKKQFTYLIGILLFMCSLPSFVNNAPFLTDVFYLPNFWVQMYPILYYSIGSYIRRYDVVKMLRKQDIWLMGLFNVAITLFGVAYNFHYANPYAGFTEGYYPSIVVVLQSVTLFLVLMRIPFKENRLVTAVAKVTLPMYLMSYMVDKTVYAQLLSMLGDGKKLINYMPVIVLFICVISFMAAYVLDKMNEAIWKVVSRITRTKKKSSSN